MAPPKGYRWALAIPGTVSNPEAVRESARFGWLCVLAEIEPDVLCSLAAVRNEIVCIEGRPVGDAFNAWAQRWALEAPWVLGYVGATLALWSDYPHLAGQTWDEGGSDAGGWIAEGQTVAGPQWYRDAAAFGWLALHHLGRAGATEIAREANVTPQAVDIACRALADLIGIPHRRRRRGRPKKSPPTIS